MSATFRGSVRRDRDLYATPKHAFEPLIPYIDRLDCEVWEPACGDRRLINWMIDSAIMVEGSDISEGKDFLSDHTQRSCIVTNPPFSLAFQFCKHAVGLSDHVFLLLRLNFLASRKRRDWFMNNEPSALFILTKRPSFTDDGKTDATDYAWFYWGKEYSGVYHL